jgi:hypothetical protein
MNLTYNLAKTLQQELGQRVEACQDNVDFTEKITRSG